MLTATMKVFNVTSALAELQRPQEPAKGKQVFSSMAKGRTGAANGRTGGKLSGEARARNALQAMPRVKIVGAIAKPPKGGDVAVPAPESSPRSAGLAAAAAAAAAMGAALGLTPTRMAQAQQVAVAAVAAQQAAAATTAATQKTPGSELRPAAGGKRKHQPFGGASPGYVHTTMKHDPCSWRRLFTRP